jgi:hypothetical protein
MWSARNPALDVKKNPSAKISQSIANTPNAQRIIRKSGVLKLATNVPCENSVTTLMAMMNAPVWSSWACAKRLSVSHIPVRKPASCVPRLRRTNIERKTRGVLCSAVG